MKMPYLKKPIFVGTGSRKVSTILKRTDKTTRILPTRIGMILDQENTTAFKNIGHKKLSKHLMRALKVKGVDLLSLKGHSLLVRPTPSGKELKKRFSYLIRHGIDGYKLIYNDKKIKIEGVKNFSLGDKKIKTKTPDFSFIPHSALSLELSIVSARASLPVNFIENSRDGIFITNPTGTMISVYKNVFFKAFQKIGSVNKL